MYTRILTSTLLFLIAIGGFVVSYDVGSIQVSQSHAADPVIAPYSAAKDSQLANEQMAAA
jgi:hypothetical protein